MKISSIQRSESRGSLICGHDRPLDPRPARSSVSEWSPEEIIRGSSFAIKAVLHHPLPKVSQRARDECHRPDPGLQRHQVIMIIHSINGATGYQLRVAQARILSPVSRCSGGRLCGVWLPYRLAISANRSCVARTKVSTGRVSPQSAMISGNQRWP